MWSVLFNINIFKTAAHIIYIVFTARRKASFASAVYATSGISVSLSVYLSVHPSVTLRYCAKRGNAEGCGLHRRVAQVSSFLVPGMVAGGRPCPGKI